MTFHRARIAGLTAVAALCGALTLLAPASEAQKPAKPVVLKMVQKGKTFAFTGPNRIAKGQELTFLNETDVRKGGPHTASVVDPTLLPETKADMKACGRKLEGLCGAIAFDKGHRVDLETMKIGRPDIDVGKTGWDREFGKTGDSWFSETLGETETRKVTAKTGSTLTFFCAIHPEMVKKLEITK